MILDLSYSVICSINKSSSIRSSNFLSFSFIPLCFGLVGHLSIFQISPFPNYLMVIMLYLHLLCMNYVKHKEQRNGHSEHSSFRQIALISSFEWAWCKQVNLHLRVNLDDAFISKYMSLNNYLFHPNKIKLNEETLC